MGRKGLFSSAAAGGSLIAASLVLVVGVSALIGFRGFRSARDVQPQQSVVLKSVKADEREAGAPATQRAVVIGGAARTATSRSARRTATRRSGRTRTASTAGQKVTAPARSGLSSRTKKRPAPVATQAPAAPDPTPAPETAPEQKAPPATPVDEVVEDVTAVVDDATKKPSESVGDVLLDIRDVLP